MKEKKRSTLNWVLEFAGERKTAYVLSVIFAIMSVLCQMMPFVIIADLIAGLLAGEKDFGAMQKKCGLMAVCWLGKQLFHALSTTESHKATFHVLGTVRKRALERLSVMSLGDVDARGSGNLKNIIVERIDSIETTLAHILPEFTSNLLVTALMLIYIFILDWRMGFAAMITFPVGFIFYMGMMLDYRPNYERTLRATKNLNDTAVEYIGGIEVIKVFGKVRGSYEKFAAAAREGADSYIDWMKKCNIFFSLAMVIVPATLITVLPFGVYFVSKGTLGQADFILIIMLSMALFEPLLTCMSYSDDIHVLDSVMGQITDIIGAKELKRPKTDRAKPRDSSVCFEKVHFGYGEKEVLHGINIFMKPGTVNALVGPSGSGKSTIAKLLASYWDVNSGSIEIGGVDIRDLSAETYHRLVAYVSQDSFLFDDTVMENIRMGNPSASDEQVMEAAKKSGCHDFIMELEHGYQTVSGNAGGHLSGGERQRISIARAMLKDAPVIILDEATAYTDPENEAIIQQSIAKLAAGKTLIVIAHRLSTISDADQIIVVRDGRIEDSGKHEELLERRGLYEQMWKAHISVKDSLEGEERDA